jgi:hypothetical protein
VNSKIIGCFSMKTSSLYGYSKDTSQLENFLQVLSLSKEDFSATISIYNAHQNPKETSKKAENVQIELRVDNLKPDQPSTIQSSFITQEKDRKTLIKTITKGNISGNNLSEFFASMDFRFQYDYIQKGIIFVLKNATVTISTIQRNDKDQKFVDPGKLVEISALGGNRNITDVENEVFNLAENLKMFLNFSKQ